jgi:hypothetical protein
MNMFEIRHQVADGRRNCTMSRTMWSGEARELREFTAVQTTVVHAALVALVLW